MASEVVIRIDCKKIKNFQVLAMFKVQTWDGVAEYERKGRRVEAKGKVLYAGSTRDCGH